MIAALKSAYIRRPAHRRCAGIGSMAGLSREGHPAPEGRKAQPGRARSERARQPAWLFRNLVGAPPRHRRIGRRAA